MKTNFIPLPSSDQWNIFIQPYHHEAVYSKDVSREALNIHIDSPLYGVGKWMTQFPIAGEKTYEFSVKAESDCTVNDLFVIITVLDQNGKMITRDHARNFSREDRFVRFYDTLSLPKEATDLKVELWLKGYQGSVTWFDPVLTETKALPKRLVNIAIAYIPPADDSLRTIESNKKDIFDAIDASGALDPDIIVLSEAMYKRGISGFTYGKAAQTDNGEMCTLIGEKAKQYHSYIVYNFIEIDKREYYNTSVLIDRDGKVVGKYRKTHLTVAELECGLTPGNDYPVFETDFGRVGMLICWDHYFPFTAEKLVENGAEIICVSTAGDAAEQSIARARDNGTYLAICGWGRSQSSNLNIGPGRIIAPNGKVIAHTAEKNTPAFACIDLNEKVRTYWLSLGDAMSENYSIYKYEKNIHSS